MTNGDRIRSMSTYDFLVTISNNLWRNTTGCVIDMIVGDRMCPCSPGCECDECIEKWLEEEAPDDPQMRKDKINKMVDDVKDKIVSMYSSNRGVTHGDAIKIFKLCDAISREVNKYDER